MAMIFEIIFYEDRHGKSPVKELLVEIMKTNPGDHEAIVRSIERMRNSQSHRPPLSKPIGDGLFEIRHVGKLNARIFYFFQIGRRIVLVHGVRHKAQKIADSDRKIALTRMQDYTERQNNG